jgi:predicted alpha/beta hydrolase
MKESSIYIPFDGGKLHLKRITKNELGKAVFLLHGSIENGKIFYSKSLKGYAPFLASQGYDVFVLDMQGRGLSTPKINKNSQYGQVDVIKSDIPLSLAKIQEIKGDVPIHAAAHSWGGVLMLAYMSRFENSIKSLVTFGSKRQLTVRNWEWFKQVLLGWHLMGSLFTLIYGYFPAKKFNIGSDNEPKNHYQQINKWLKPGSQWIDNIDGFDYGKALETKALPPLLFLAGKNDHLLGNPIDVKLLAAEVKNAKISYWLLSKSDGYAKDYGHINMLTDKNASTDFFGKVMDWMEG